MAVSCMCQRQIRALVVSVLSQNMSRRNIIFVVRVFSSETLQLVLFKTADSVVSSLDELALVQQSKKQGKQIRILVVCQRTLQRTGINTQRTASVSCPKCCTEKLK